MKDLNIVLLIFVVLTVGCKSQKIAPKPEPINSETITKNAANTVKPSPVTLKKERVTAANGESADFGLKRFYIIMGSFREYNNALNFKNQLINEDYSAGILVNENGLYRVSIESYDDETIARSRISDIRKIFPIYRAVWLLVKKQ